jgi:hypothetical protein
MKKILYAIGLLALSFAWMGAIYGYRSKSEKSEKF